MDPEIPTVSILDLGVITRIELSENEVFIEMVPTFAGCPAIQLMRLQVEQALREKAFEKITVEVNYRKEWSSANVTVRGRERLKAFGIAPPPAVAVTVDNLEGLLHTPCPKCNSTNTTLTSSFGPTLCRAIHYCNDCHEAFEQFKPV